MVFFGVHPWRLVPLVILNAILRYLACKVYVELDLGIQRGAAFHPPIELVNECFCQDIRRLLAGFILKRLIN